MKLSIRTLYLLVKCGDRSVLDVATEYKFFGSGQFIVRNGVIQLDP